MKPDLSRVDPLQYNLATRVNLGDVLTRAATMFPDRVAVVDGDEPVTYRRLTETADRLGHALLGLGLPHQAPVALMMTNSWRFLATYFACARAGLVALPLNVMLSPEGLGWILDDAGATVIVADGALRGLLEATLAGSLAVETVVVVGATATAPVATRTTYGWDDLVAGEQPRPLEVLVDDRDSAQCLYTSGTTSRPKGVLTSHVAVTIALTSNALVMGSRWGSSPSTMLVVLPFFHVTALNTLAMPILMMGGTVVLPGGKFDPGVVLDAIERHRATHLMMLPIMHAACVAAQAQRPRDLSSVQMAIYAMAPMPSHLLDEVDAMYPSADVVLGSGQTEVVPATVMQWAEHRHTAPDSWGPSVPSVLTRAMGPDGAVLDPGRTGELVYRAPNVCSGYWNNPEANEVAFEHGWFHSGDIGHIDDEGVVWFTDRLKDIIKSGGENVSSVAVEAVVLGVPGVAECTVIGVPDERWGEVVCAVVVPDGTVPSAELEDRVIEHAREHLAGFESPKVVRIVDALPKTATGKVQKHEVRASTRPPAGS